MMMPSSSSSSSLINNTQYSEDPASIFQELQNSKQPMKVVRPTINSVRRNLYDDFTECENQQISKRQKFDTISELKLTETQDNIIDDIIQHKNEEKVEGKTICNYVGHPPTAREYDVKNHLNLLFSIYGNFIPWNLLKLDQSNDDYINVIIKKSKKLTVKAGYFTYQTCLNFIKCDNVKIEVVDNVDEYYIATFIFCKDLSNPEFTEKCEIKYDEYEMTDLRRFDFYDAIYYNQTKFPPRLKMLNYSVNAYLVTVERHPFHGTSKTDPNQKFIWKHKIRPKEEEKKKFTGNIDPEMAKMMSKMHANRKLNDCYYILIGKINKSPNRQYTFYQVEDSAPFALKQITINEQDCTTYTRDIVHLSSLQNVGEHIGWSPRYLNAIDASATKTPFKGAAILQNFGYQLDKGKNAALYFNVKGYLLDLIELPHFEL